MEHAGKDAYFRDVHVFVDKIIDVSRTKSDVVRQNLQLCFRGSVLKWYISEFTDNKKRLLTYGNGVLRARFKTTRSTGMGVMLKKRYIMNDVTKRRKFRKYAQTVCYDLSLTGRFAGNVCQGLSLAGWANVGNVPDVSEVSDVPRRS